MLAMEQEDFLQTLTKQRTLVNECLQLMEVLNEPESANQLTTILQDLTSMNQEHGRYLTALSSLPEPQLNENSQDLFDSALENVNAERENESSSEESSVEEENPDTSALGDRSIVLSQVGGIPIDPITKGKIMQPARNSVCNHVYEHDVILTYLKQQAARLGGNKKKKVRCPYIGCNNDNVLIEHINKDEQLRKNIIATMDTENPGTDMSFVDIS